MKLIYHISIHALGLAFRIASLFHPKARKWVQGRKNWEQQLKDHKKPGTWVWFHCASLGEFEQGRNLIDYIHDHFPNYRILITFFSPSGYEVRKSYKRADLVTYLPLDTAANVRKFVEIIQPTVVFFVKYELWINLISELNRRKIPLVLISARVDKRSPFFTSMFASLYKKAFGSFQAIFTQDLTSARLIRDFSQHPQVIASSDTRYDRVAANRDTFTPLPEIERFRQNRLCLMGGSTWPKGAALMHAAYQALKDRYDLCMILAPHEIRPSSIQTWIDKFPKVSLTYSKIDQLTDQHDILWIDNIGMLSRLYAYADVAYVGGGWGTGLHNILEAAVFGCPVIIGPEHTKFPEAGDLIAVGGAFSIQDETEFIRQLEIMLAEDQLRADIQRTNVTFITDRAGATQQILDWCLKNNLLTS